MFKIPPALFRCMKRNVYSPLAIDFLIVYSLFLKYITKLNDKLFKYIIIIVVVQFIKLILNKKTDFMQIKQLNKIYFIK